MLFTDLPNILFNVGSKVMLSQTREHILQQENETLGTAEKPTGLTTLRSVWLCVVVMRPPNGLVSSHPTKTPVSLGHPQQDSESTLNSRPQVTSSFSQLGFQETSKKPKELLENKYPIISHNLLK